MIQLRLSLFVTMAVLEDVETQKKGAVGITMWHKVSIDDFHKRGQCHKRIKEAFPIRLSAIHFCLPHENASSNDSSSPQLLRLLKAMFVMSIGAENRPHMRIHIGSTVECMYALQSFGILTEQIPVNATTGETKTKQHLKWLDLKLQNRYRELQIEPGSHPELDLELPISILAAASSKSLPVPVPPARPARPHAPLTRRRSSLAATTSTSCA